MIAEFSPDHPSWQVLRAEIVARIDKLRDSLEQDGLEHGPTQHMRGQIAALRRLVRDAEERPVEPKPSPGYA